MRRRSRITSIVGLVAGGPPGGSCSTPRSLSVRGVQLGPVTVPVETDDGGHWLVKAEPFFRLRHYAVGDGLRLRTDGAFKLATVIKGQAAVGWRSGGQDELCIARQGDTVLVPASCPEVYISAVGDTRVLISDPGR